MKSSNCTFVHVVEESSPLNSSCKVFVDIQDETVPALSMGTLPTLALISMVSICVLINTVGKIFIIYYIKKKAPKRPLNDMFLIDQCLQLPSFILHGIFVTSSLIMKKPLFRIFGNNFCIVMLMNMLFHTIILVINGTGMAFFRFICFILSDKISIHQHKLVKNLILILQLMIGSLVYGLGLVGNNYTQMASSYDFCRGYTREMSHIISMYQGGQENIQYGQKLKNIAIFIAQLNILFELFCYVTIMVKLYQHDKELVKDKVINTKERQRRNKKNAITLTGQVLSFIVELGYTVVLGPLADHRTILIIFCWTAITLIQIGTSPEIRRFLRTETFLKRFF